MNPQSFTLLLRYNLIQRESPVNLWLGRKGEGEEGEEAEEEELYHSDINHSDQYLFWQKLN